jgi:hypothetical protein
MRNRLSHAAGDWWGRDLMRKAGKQETQFSFEFAESLGFYGKNEEPIGFKGVWRVFTRGIMTFTNPTIGLILALKSHGFLGAASGGNQLFSNPFRLCVA